MAAPSPRRADGLRGPRDLRDGRRPDGPAGRVRRGVEPVRDRRRQVRGHGARHGRRRRGDHPHAPAAGAPDGGRDRSPRGGRAVSVTEPELAVVALEKVVDVDAHEGPVYVESEHALYFTTTPRPGPEVAIKRLDLATGEIRVVRGATNAANGMALDLDGRLLVCEQGRPYSWARISRFDPATGAIETVVDELGGLPLNSPNDVVVRSDGSIWFTDPSYGWYQGFKPEPAHGDYVYRFADARLTVVEDSFDKPNGLAFSPD